MVDAVRRDFADRGFEPAGFYYEKFALAARPDPEQGAEDLEGAQPESDATTPAVGRVERDGESAAGRTPVPVEPLDPEPAVELIQSGEGRELDGQTILPRIELAELGPDARVAAASDLPDGSPVEDLPRRMLGRVVLPGRAQHGERASRPGHRGRPSSSSPTTPAASSARTCSPTTVVEPLVAPRAPEPRRAPTAEVPCRAPSAATATRSGSSTPRSRSPTRSSTPAAPSSSARSSSPSAGSPRGRSRATGCSRNRRCPTSTWRTSGSPTRRATPSPTPPSTTTCSP